METIRFMTSLLTFYIKGEIAFDRNFVKLKQPNTILTLIPLGARNVNVPVPQIASANTNFKLAFKPFLIGVIVAIVGLCLFKSSFLLGLIVFLIGALMVINSFQTYLFIEKTSGKGEKVQFLVFQKSKADLAANQINALIAQRQDDTNVTDNTNRQMAQAHADNAALLDALKNNRD